MMPTKRSSMLVCAIGYSVLFSLAFTGVVHICFQQFATPLGERGSSHLATISGMLTGGLSAYLYGWFSKYART